MFLQQLGRGLRKYPNKEYLTVVDFIGNYKRAHYIPKLLSGENPLIESKRPRAFIDEMDLPEDCVANFDFKLIDLFEEMRRKDPLRERMKDEYYRLKNQLGRRPMRVDMYQGSDIPIREYLKKGYLRFLYELGELDEVEEAWINTIGEEFLMEVEKTSMSKSYKIPVLLSFIKNGVMVTDVSIEEVGKSFMDYYKNSKVHRRDFTDKKHANWQEWDFERYTKEALQNPIKFLSRSKFFNHDEINKRFTIIEEVKPFVDSRFMSHYIDIIKYRELSCFSRRFKEDKE